MSSLDSVLAQADAALDRSRARLFALLRIPSISAQPAHAEDCRRAAEWVRGELAGLGFAASLRPTAGHPVVLAHHPGPAEYAGPHILFYGHYDVQPVDPVALWSSPPFEPQLVDGPRGKRFVARGAVDDKGQMMMFIEALRAWKDATGTIPARITVLIEGEEEVGSVNLAPFLATNADALRADLALISDTGMWDVETPAVTTRLRGLAYVELLVRAASRDLHSGLFGGSALNPINALTRVLGDLQDAEGRVQVPGFYDGVREPGAAQAADWAALGFDEAAFLGGVGLSEPAGELAGAKISFRLVPGQVPAQVIAGFERFVAARLPRDARWELHTLSSSPAIEVPDDSPWVRAARDVLGEEYGRPAVLMGSGGSIPVVSSLREVLGIDSLLMGFGLDDDQVHSPNEKFEQVCFHHGIRAHARLLGKLAGV
jgi:acetylornithine deacetylase/succinyl-diaminopimelate desuccinylase-like protein